MPVCSVRFCVRDRVYRVVFSRDGPHALPASGEPDWITITGGKKGRGKKASSSARRVSASMTQVFLYYPRSLGAAGLECAHTPLLTPLLRHVPVPNHQGRCAAAP